MFRLRLALYLRSAIFILVAVTILTIIGTLWWANVTGLPDSWRLAIEREISIRHGLNLKIGSLSYNPLRGIIARKVSIYDNPDRTHEISHLESLILDFDNTQLARGVVRLEKVILSDATLKLAIDPMDQESEVIMVTNANGTLLLPGRRRIIIQNAYGNLNGIHVVLNARLHDSDQSTSEHPSPVTIQPDNRRKTARRVINELSKWSFDPQQTPEILIFAEGDTNDTQSLKARMSFSARAIEKNQHRLDSLTIEAEISGNLLTVTSLEATNGGRKLSGHLDCDLSKFSGRYGIRSSLEIPPLLQAWFELPPMGDLLVAGQQEIEASGGFAVPPDQPHHLQMTGKMRCTSTMLRGIRFDTIQSSFSWLDGDVFLKDMHLKRPDGEAQGKALIQWPMLRISLESTLPPNIYQSLFQGKKLAEVIERFETSDDSSFHITLEGGLDLTEKTSWAFTGASSGTNIAYNGVPISKGSCSFSLSAHQLLFSNGQGAFDYTNYPLHQQFNGPASGNLSFNSIQYTSEDRMIRVDQMNGDFWPAPLVRMFHTGIADHLERYAFHTPPTLNGSGRIDIGKNGLTQLDIDFTSSSAANYMLMGGNVLLTRPKGSVSIHDQLIDVQNLDFETMGGTASVNISVNSSSNQLQTEIQWTKWVVDEIDKCWNLGLKCGGRTTGRVELSMSNNDVSTLDGNGLFALEKSELLSVPMFGPLSKVISGVLRDKRAGHERAKDAFCSFEIDNGVLRTDDFTTATSSLVFVGDGSVNLSDRTLDMTIRMNARGLLGILTLPIRPFYGMFQFRGTGPLKKTQWDNVMFTTPNDKQRKILSEIPRAKVVSPED